MRRLTLLLSGEHPTIPSSEAIAAIEAENHSCKNIEEFDQVLNLETDIDPRSLSRRLGMCHWIGEHFCTCGVEELNEAMGSSDILDFLPQSESIAVRVKRVRNSLPDVDSQRLSKKIADKILEEYDYEIDLEHPDNEITCVLTGDKCVLGIVKKRVVREAFEERNPQKRAVVHPSTMQPYFARALVNLARTPRNGVFLDPFCGVGGILIEAGLLGVDLIGVDIDSVLIKGAKKNLEEIGVQRYDLRTKNAKNLKVNKVDAIATDPPYGRQSSTKGCELEELYKNTLPVLADVLKVKKYLCITAPVRINLEKISKDLSLNLKEKHQQRVHRSLTRNVYVFQKVKR